VIPLLSRAEVRAFDRDAIARLGVPGLVLMENAGAHAARLLRLEFPERLSQVLVLGGAGQNGGDAWVVARHLLAAGQRPRCMLLADASKLSGDARVNFDALAALGLTVEQQPAPALVAQAAREASLIVDGLFGTGLDRPLAGPLLEVVAAINAAGVPVLALDLPSGVDADTGQVLGAAVQATLTVTFAAHKPGLHQHPGAACAGELHCVDIGVPGPPAGRRGLIEARDVAALLPPRRADAHKGSSGHVLAIAGSAGKTGAALLAATGALRAGAGLVTIASDAETRRALDHKVLELMTAEFPAQGALEALLELARGKASALLGPGFGLAAEARALACALARALPVPSVIDADALTALASEPSALRTAARDRVLTPHPGEAARLLGRSIPAIQADRLGAAHELALLTGQVVVLKGAGSVIAAPDGALRVCRAGTPALGTAGTGDVLSGIIAALLVELSAFDAALCGVELHARAGELAARSDRGLLAHEVADVYARALEQVRAEARR
jgi:NAD(P)H-hydrate epimerase